MRLNENLQIIGKEIILVPYEAKHVPKYHKWMQNVELQELTASEPLTIEQEYEMQLSWRQDTDKCTFLILCKQTLDETTNEIDALVGDTNLFIRRDADTKEQIGEAEIMIAEPSARGKGYGWEAMLLMLKYGQEQLGIDRYEAKIGFDNERSIRMFDKMEFFEVARSNVFREITLQCNVTQNWIEWLDKQVVLNYKPYMDVK